MPRQETDGGVDESIMYFMTKYDGVLRRLADIGPLTLERIESEHKLCDSTLRNCPFCILIDEINRLRTAYDVEHLRLKKACQRSLDRLEEIERKSNAPTQS